LGSEDKRVNHELKISDFIVYTIYPLIKLRGKEDTSRALESRREMKPK
jgi:hypothetical protein